MTGASLGSGTYQYSARYDALLRATDLKVTNASGSTTFFEQARSFDAASNVTQATTTLQAGSDNQAFCYDEQNRLTWAGAAGTPPCGVSLTPGTLTAAQYTHSFAYDNLGRLTSGPAGSYTYGNTAHLHAATAIGTSWTAAYDAAGNMSCRAPLASLTCSGTATGAPLSFDAQGQLSAWQNTPSTPTSTDGFLYDNQGNRVEQQSTQAGTTTTTVYVGNLEQIATSGSSTTTTTYYYANGQRIALAVNGVFSYLASDGLGSAVVAVSASGGFTASLLFSPYGGVRYSNGTMPTDYGFTGQRADATTGLDYYNARYYDPVAGQFASADSILPGDGYNILGLSRYAYVEGNPEDRTDPSGKFAVPLPVWGPGLVPVPGPVLELLEGGGGAASAVGVVARGGSADLLGALLILGALLPSSSGPPEDYQSDQPEVYKRNRPQRLDEQRRVTITPNRWVTESEVDRWEVELQLKMRNAEQVAGGSGQGRIPPGAGRFMLKVLGLGVGGTIAATLAGLDPWDVNPSTQLPAAPAPTHDPWEVNPSSQGPGPPAATPPSPASQTSTRREKNLD
jgi:RHS repeat-associated protein